MTGVIKEMLMTSGQSWGRFFFFFLLLLLCYSLNDFNIIYTVDHFEKASEHLQQQARGYYPTAIKYIHQGDYLLCNQTSPDFKQLAFERLLRVFSEAIPADFATLYQDLKTTIHALPVEDYVTVLLRGITRLSLDNWLDPEDMDWRAASDRLYRAIREIENDILTSVRHDIQRSNVSCMQCVFEFGQQSLIEEMCEWAVNNHPEVFCELGDQEEVETFLLKNSYKVSAIR